jgi:5-methylcytosine-specific restriction endonuclease McrA
MPEQPPTASSTIGFGEKLLSLLDTGSFTTSYKYALLLALIDATIEGTRPDGSPPPTLSGRDLGRRVMELYWRQARPYTDRGPLRQSAQRDLVVKTSELRQRLGIAQHAPIEQARLQHPAELADLEREVIATVIRYPIPLLQRFGTGSGAVEDRFIYEIGWQEGVSTGRVHGLDFDDRLHLVEAAGDHLAELAGLVRPVIEREWLRHIARRNEGDVDELRLETFLFGGERTSLAAVRDPLLRIQAGRCFYCYGERGPWEVDHFLPWSRWPDDRLDNLVAAHRRCNNDKRAALASVDHLEVWWDRFDPTGAIWRQLDEVSDDVSWPRRPVRTAAGARGLYHHQPAGTMLWAGEGRVAPLDPTALQGVFAGLDLAAEDPDHYQE